MAARKKARKVLKKSVRSRPTKGSKASPTGAVTLAEARAIVTASHSVSKTLATAAPPTNPADVGRARKELEQRRDNERTRRIREYKETLAIMKRRGARAPTSKGKPPPGTPAPHAGPFIPLQILAEGDSWFDYPYPLFGGGIIPRLENLIGVPILNLAKAGDEVRYMLGVKERKILVEQLTQGCPAGGPWDALLFSGGGNDIVDNPMVLWVKDFVAGPPASLINQPRFDAALELVRAGYEDLIALRNQLSPSTHLFFHSYDFAIPDGRGVCLFGPWLKPTFDMRRFPTQSAGFGVVKAMLQQFLQMQILVQAQPAAKNVTVIPTQGTLQPVVASWHNELHPAKAGFNTFAQLFRDQIKAVFPQKVA